MKKNMIAVLLIWSATSVAQVEKPKKNYEYQDTRKKTESFAKLPADLKAELSTFTFSGIDEGIKRDPLAKVPYTSIGQNFITIEAPDIKANITTARGLFGIYNFEGSEADFGNIILININNLE